MSRMSLFRGAGSSTHVRATDLSLPCFGRVALWGTQSGDGGSPLGRCLPWRAGVGEQRAEQQIGGGAYVQIAKNHQCLFNILLARASCHSPV